MDPGTDPHRARTLVAALNASMRGRDRAPLVVTCRTGDYQALAKDIDRATHVQMLPLTGREAARYLDGQFRTGDEHQRRATVLATLRTDPPGPLAVQLATPWRLTLALTAFRDAGDPMILAPVPWPPGAPESDYGERVEGLLLDAYIETAIACTSLLGGTPQTRSSSG